MTDAMLAVIPDDDNSKEEIALLVDAQKADQARDNRGPRHRHAPA